MANFFNQQHETESIFSLVWYVFSFQNFGCAYMHPIRLLFQCPCFWFCSSVFRGQPCFRLLSFGLVSRSSLDGPVSAFHLLVLFFGLLRTALIPPSVFWFCSSIICGWPSLPSIFWLGSSLFPGRPYFRLPPSVFRLPSFGSVHQSSADDYSLLSLPDPRVYHSNYSGKFGRRFQFVTSASSQHFSV